MCSMSYQILNILVTIFMELSPSWKKPPVVQLLKNSPTIYGTQSFIVVLIRDPFTAPYPTIRSIPHYPIALRFILILSTHLRLYAHFPHSLAGLWTKNECAGEEQQQFTRLTDQFFPEHFVLIQFLFHHFAVHKCRGMSVYTVKAPRMKMHASYASLRHRFEYTRVYIYIYCDGIWSSARQRLGKHCLKPE
jgi:hypothetical protein